MATDNEIKTALGRARRAMELRPPLAQGTMSVGLVLEDGIKCTSRFGDWQVEIDEPTSIGGENSAPMPGVYGFSALAGCLAMSIKMLAVEADIKIDRIAIDVEGDYDDRAFFGIGDAAPGYAGLRLSIDVRSDVPDDQIQELVAQARVKSTWFNTIANMNPIATHASRKPAKA